jgi:hypothetical protein
MLPRLTAQTKVCRSSKEMSKRYFVQFVLIVQDLLLKGCHARGGRRSWILRLLRRYENTRMILRLIAFAAAL